MEDAERDNDEPFEGVDIDSPLGRVRLGRAAGRGVQANAEGVDDAYKAARRRVRRRIHVEPPHRPEQQRIQRQLIAVIPLEMLAQAENAKRNSK